ncbi:MAG: 16S rRNA (cytosine(1402)-N(4))-methyltransferase RsmH, partial [Lachnospiraceae bacterium]|nr:16S rRNA (cytosine(1402)-N(4))-methyltransferase RsmH [Lachnospiraceae bacterium]
IAAAIVRERGQAPIETTGQLAEIIRAAMPARARKEKQHPAKRSFQAIRIAVNDELGEVERLLACALDVLNPGGRLAVISFHSLEDRLVKTAYTQWAKGCTCPPDFPVCVCGKTPKARLVGKRPITADGEELTDNPRARSAKLRIAEKL